jgi:hypothetical protein
MTTVSSIKWYKIENERIIRLGMCMVSWLMWFIYDDQFEKEWVLEGDKLFKISFELKRWLF